MSTLKFAPETIETVAVSDLKPYEKNPRTHSPQQVAKIVASMREFGWTVPVLINEQNEIIAGHGRVMAATEMGITSVPAIRIAHLTDAQVKALRIADNQTVIAGEWDPELLSFEIHDLNGMNFDLGLLGFDSSDLANFLNPVGDGGEEITNADNVLNTLAERFGIPPFSVLNAREGWWQDRKRAWVSLGIQSELGRGGGMTWGDSPEVTQTGLNFYRNKKAAAKATPGGALMPATDYSKSGKRGDSRGRAIGETT